MGVMVMLKEGEPREKPCKDEHHGNKLGPWPVWWEVSPLINVPLMSKSKYEYLFSTKNFLFLRPFPFHFFRL